VILGKTAAILIVEKHNQWWYLQPLHVMQSAYRINAGKQETFSKSQMVHKKYDFCRQWGPTN
jgi:hypothetical protein